MAREYTSCRRGPNIQRHNKNVMEIETKLNNMPILLPIGAAAEIRRMAIELEFHRAMDDRSIVEQAMTAMAAPPPYTR